jgi:hypothetical protein
MTEFSSIKERKQWEGLLKVFGDTENGKKMAKLVMKAQNGQITDEDRNAYAKRIEDDLALIRTELVEGCIPPIDHIITPEENERLKREIIEREKPQLRELMEEAADAGIPITEHLAKELNTLYDC